MATLEEIFYKEFNQMMQMLKGYNGYHALDEVPIPNELQSKFTGAVVHDKVAIHGIDDEYFGKLNDTEVLLWNKGALNRRKFDYKGEFMKDKDGNYLLEDVILPHKCLAVVSNTKIGVPNRYTPKNKDSLVYVDYLEKTNADGTRSYKYIYIIPRKYLYLENQTALVLSWNKLRTYYTGYQLSLKNGNYLYLYVIPYRITSSVKNYRVLTCKTNTDYETDINTLVNFWINQGIMFNPAECVLYEDVKGRSNLAYQEFNGVLADFERFRSDKSMDEFVESNEFDFEGENVKEDFENIGKFSFDEEEQ